MPQRREQGRIQPRMHVEVLDDIDTVVRREALRASQGTKEDQERAAKKIECLIDLIREPTRDGEELVRLGLEFLDGFKRSDNGRGSLPELAGTYTRDFAAFARALREDPKSIPQMTD